MSEQGRSALGIHAWLSYRCADPVAIAARDKLETACSDHGIDLMYDRKGAKEGDDFLEFMDHLITARVIFFFFQPGFFESENTLFELIHVHEDPHCTHRRVIPVCLDSTLYGRVEEKTAFNRVKSKWDETNSLRENTRRRLQEREPGKVLSEVEVWQRIDRAWHGILDPHLKLLAGEQPDLSKLSELAAYIRKAVEKTYEDVQQAISTSNKALAEKVRDEIAFILHRNAHINKEAFKWPFARGANGEQDLAALMTLETSEDVLARLNRIAMTSQKGGVSNQTEEKWFELLDDIEQAMGWLLLLSVEPNWWYQNELHFRGQLKSFAHAQFAFAHTGYIEVVVGRSALSQPIFTLDEKNQVQPGGFEHNPRRFDGFSTQAEWEELLIPLYEDLIGSKPGVVTLEELLEDLARTAKMLFRTLDGRMIYYIVSSNYLTSLRQQDWFPQAQEAFGEFLLFVSCDRAEKPYDCRPCIDKPADLLEYPANILRLKQKAEQNDQRS